MNELYEQIKNFLEENELWNALEEWMVKDVEYLRLSRTHPKPYKLSQISNTTYYGKTYLSDKVTSFL